jgi:polyferredoxin
MAKKSKIQKNNSSDISTRTVIQIIFLVGTILIGLRHIMPGESSKGGAFDVFCPFGAVETFWTFITTGETLKTTSPLNFSILFGVLGVSFIAGRAFCGWMCPVGTLQDFLANLSKRYFRNKKKQPAGKQIPLPFRISLRNDAWLRSLKYLVLAIILQASTFAVYPPLREICPARALLSFQLTTPLLWSVLITFVITSLVNRRFWCKYLCPLGAILAPFNKVAPLRLVLNTDSCTNCRRCESACPMDIPDLTHNLRSAECIECLQCQETCNEQDALELQLF